MTITAILTITDTFSKTSIFIPCHETINAIRTALLYATYVLPHYVLPSCIISDHDPWFTVHITKELCQILSITQCQDLAGSWYAQRECGNCGCKGSVVQWFCGSEESVVAQMRQRLRGNYLDCKYRTKTRLRSNYSYYMILIVEDAQPITYERKQEWVMK